MSIERALASLLSVFLARAAGAEPELQLRGFDELVRLDADSGRWLDAPRGVSRVEALAWGAGPVSLEAARDEVVSFALWVTGPARAVPVRWRPEAGPDGGPSPVEVQVFEARPVRVRAPSRGLFIRSLGPGAYPDALVPTSTVTPRPPPGGVTLFVDLWVPRGATPGAHRGGLEVGEVRLPVVIEVAELALPAEDLSGLGAVSFGAFQARRVEHPEGFRAAMQLLHAHRFNVELISPWRPRASERGDIDWEGWADEVGPYLDGTAFGPEAGYRGPRPGQPVRRFVVPVTEKWPSPPTAGRPSDPRAFVDALREFEALGVRRGFFRPGGPPEFVLFINDLDEPRTSADFEALAAYRGLLEPLERRDRVVFRVDGPFGAGVAGWSDPEVVERLAPVLDAVALCGGPPWISSAGLAALAQRRPDARRLVYASNTAGEPTLAPVVIDAPVAGLVSWAWLVRKNQLAGALNWELDFRPGCYAEPMCSGEAQNLDATLLYRAEELGGPAGHLFPSWRLKALRRGAQDLALLSLLEDKDPRLAQQLVDLVAPEPLDATPGEGVGAWPVDPATWATIRRALRAELRAPGSIASVEALRAAEPAPRRFPSRPVLLVLTLALLGAWLARRLALGRRI